MDYSFDPCQAVAKLDLNDPAELKKILRRDKHTRIEGICTEALFVRELLSESFPHFSTGWWFLRKDNQFRVMKILPAAETLSNLDFDLLAFFSVKANIPTFILSFDEQAKNFYSLKFEFTSKEDLEKNGSIRKKLLEPRQPSAPLPKPAERQPQRLEQAVNLLESLGLLKRAAVERLFANCWLASGTYWDIDAFALHEGQFLAFEVKQKYPTASGTFGLNKGLSRLFEFLSAAGIKVIHLILTKPISDYRTSAIDLYTQEKYKNLSLWIATIFNKDMLSSSLASAPARTSIYGAQKLDFYHIQPQHFSKVKLLGAESPAALRQFVTGHTPRLAGLSDIPKYSR
jgi:hypothetical protein